MEPFIGEIRPFAFNFVPRGWAACNGQLLPIRQYTAVFALLGVNFGGDGTTTFGLPNLVGNLAVGTGQSPGNSNWSMGEIAGSASVTLAPQEIPAHNHTLTATANGATSRSAVGTQLALASQDNGTTSFDALIYAAAAPNIPLSPQSLALSGGGQAHPNMMPSLAINYCIALDGIYPSFP